MQKKKNMLINIDGTDASGKSLQTSVLVERLAAKGINTRCFDFPLYDSPSGQLIKRGLDPQDDYINLLSLQPELAALPYALNRAAVAKQIHKALQYGYLVCNRYVPSNLAYQGAKAGPRQEQAVINFIEQLEYGEIGLPRPDLVLFLYVPTHIARELNRERGQPIDLHEAHASYQAKVSKFYRKLAREQDNWRIIECAPDGKLLEPDQVADLIWQQVMSQ